MGEVSEFPVRVYYEDTDAGGIVYNANYLKFMERARTEFLRAGGIEQDVLLGLGIAFVVSRTEIDFRAAARFNELLTVITQVTEVRRASMRSCWLNDTQSFIRACNLTCSAGAID